MSLLVVRQNTLFKTALVIIADTDGKREISTKGDFSIISVDGKITAINIANYDNYFDAKEGAHTLTTKQVEVIKKHVGEFDSKSHFTIGEVVSRENHPKSEKLFVLKVLTDKELQIVTNSLNSTVGKKVVVANLGAILPSGLVIKPAKVMGVDSQGMLCGGETLGQEQTEGVMLIDGTNGNEFIL